MNDRHQPEPEPAEADFHQLRDVLDEVSREKPLPASGNELILLEIDPHRAHVCWNIDPDQAETNKALVLRVYDITDSGNISAAAQAFDVEVFGLQGRWYLDLWRDDRTFVTQLGYRQDDGSINVLAQSNEVSTPPSEPQNEKSTGQHIDPNGNRLHTEWPGDHVAEAPVEAKVEPQPELVAVAHVEPQRVVEPVTLLDPEFPMGYWPIFSRASEQSETKATGATAVAEAADEPVPPEAASMLVAAGDTAVAFDEELMEGKPESFPPAEQLIAAVQENRGAIDAFYEAMDSRAEAAGYHASESTGPAPENPPAPTQEAARSESAVWSPVPLEQVLGLSSLEHPGRDVLLEVNAELHIYGRSKPNTELTLYGQIVKTRPDGSFSVRRPLPHGAVILPLLYTKKGDGQAEV